MDIILHCLDPSQLKNKGLQEVFPAVCRFNQVSHCPATRRIAGTNTICATLIYLSCLLNFFFYFQLVPI